MQSAIISRKVVHLLAFPVRLPQISLMRCKMELLLSAMLRINMKHHSNSIILCVLGVYSLVFTEPAFAYLDPGSGSMLLQLLFGGVAGIAVILKLYWKSFVSLFRHKRRQEDNLPPQERDT